MPKRTYAVPVTTRTLDVYNIEASSSTEASMKLALVLDAGKEDEDVKLVNSRRMGRDIKQPKPLVADPI